MTTNDKSRRPLSMTLISIFLVIGGLQTLYATFVLGIRPTGIENDLFLIFSIIVSVICGVGIWLMKKWAVSVYTGYAVINQAFLIFVGIWSMFPLILQVIVLYFLWKNLSNMN